MTKVKICGLSREEDILIANQAKPDFIGFVFADSFRQVTPVQAERLKSLLSADIRAVGVFVDATVSSIVNLYQQGTIEIAQLHGSEDADYLAELRGSCNIPIIKAVQVKQMIQAESGVDSLFDLVAMISSAAASIADYLLIDTAAGSGERFDWRLLEALPSMVKPWFMAGGIDVATLTGALAFAPWAVDVSSGVETDGFKDSKKIEQFVRRVRKHDSEMEQEND